MTKIHFLQRLQIKERILEKLSILSSFDQEINNCVNNNTDINTAADITDISLSDFLQEHNPKSFINFAYSQLLGRVPDHQGLEIYQKLVEQGLPKAWIIYDIVNSQEGQQKKAKVPGLYQPKRLEELLALKNEDFVKEVYRSILWREADDVGLNDFLGQIQQGKPQISMILDIYQSEEARKIPNQILLYPDIEYVSKLIRKENREKHNLFLFFGNLKNQIKSIVNFLQMLLFNILELRYHYLFLIEQNRDFKFLLDTRTNKLENKLDQQLQTQILPQVNARINELENKLDQQLQTQIFPQINTRINELENKLDQQLQTQIFPQINTRINELENKLDQQLQTQILLQTSDIVFLKLADYFLAVPAYDHRLVFYLSVYGTLEQGMIQFVKNLIQPNMVVVDVGAHVGIYSLLLAKLVGVQGKVYSFEPTPKTFEFLNLNLEINGYQDRVVAESIAILDREGMMKLAISNQSGLNTLFPASSDDLTIEVRTACLDDILENILQIDFLKIDAEGAEPLIWKGMKKIRQLHPGLKIIMEFAPSHLIRAGFNPEVFYQEIIEADFSVFKIHDFTGELMPISREELVNTFSVNLFLCRS